MKQVFIAFYMSISSLIAYGTTPAPLPRTASCLELGHADNKVRNICNKNNKKYLILEFFSPSCGACTRNVTQFKQLEEQTKNFAHTRLISSSPLGRTQQFLKQHNITTEVALDIAGLARLAYAVRHVPTMVIIDPDNNIIKQYVGVLSNDSINEIKKLVQETSAR